MLYLAMPVTLDEMRKLHERQSRASDARVALFRFAGKKQRSYEQAMTVIRDKGIDLAEISMDALKKEVQQCKYKCRSAGK
jgi:hypothetical protein